MPISTRAGLCRTILLVSALALAGCSGPSNSDDRPAPTPANSPSHTASPTPSPATTVTPGPATAAPDPTFAVSTATYPVPPGSAPHDVAPAADGGVWYTAQASGELGWLGPDGAEVREVPLGPGSAPHGVIVGPDEAAWVTDSGLNAIVRVDPDTLEIRAFALPASVPNVNLNTAAFDGDGILWFTGQAGWYGRLDPATGDIAAFPAPRGVGPYGITSTPDGEVVFSSLAGSYLGFIDRSTDEVRAVDPPTPGAGLRRAWSDSKGRIWTSQWNAGQVAVYDPLTDAWREWRLPGDAPQAYAVYVDETDAVWLTDFGANAIVRFDPADETFTSFPAESRPAEVRQLLGRAGEVWGAESAADRLVVVRFGD